MHHTQSLDDLAFQRSFEALGHLGVGAAKFHETMTTAWVLAVRHFMALSSPASQSAREAYVHPDLAAIPEHH
jgi:hypothetical protein